MRQSSPPSPARTFWRGGRGVQLAIVALLLAIALPIGVARAASDSQGTDFWLAFPGNYTGGGEITLFITGDTNTTGTVTVPGLAFTAPFTVTANTVTSVPLPSQVDIQTSDTVENLGIHVTAAAEVTVYGLNRIQFTTDAYLGLPTDILGTEYLALGIWNTNIVNGTEFAVVASQDNTTVTINPTVTTNGHAAGTPYNITLNQGQTYQLRNTDAAPSDLSGSVITSDKPIAVYGGQQCANIPDGNYVACDHVVEEMPPTSAWGKNFVSMPLATRLNGDTFRFLASTNATTVNVNGSPVATLNRGQFFQQIINGPAQITANNPILVAQYSNSSSFDGVTSDPFEMLIPPYEQFLSSYTISTPATGFDPNYVNVVAPNAGVGLITLDGVPIPAGSYTPIGASGFSGAQVLISSGSHHLAGLLPFGVFTYGFASYDSYGYPGGMSLAPVATVTSVALAPKTATNPVNTQHGVTATVKDQFGKAVVGVRVDFSVTGANTASGFANTDTSGLAQFCYTGTNAGNDAIVASVGTISDTAAKTWTAVQTDTTKPSCVVPSAVGVDGSGKKYAEATLQDSGSGIATINVDKSVNATTVVPAFTSGTTSPVVVRSTKINQSLSSTFQLTVTDKAGNKTTCDPVYTSVLRDSSSQTFAGLPQAESKVMILNGTPGMKTVTITVNGTKFREVSLANGETRSFDVASAMSAGSNTIQISGKGGKKDATADIFISD